MIQTATRIQVQEIWFRKNLKFHETIKPNEGSK